VASAATLGRVWARVVTPSAVALGWLFGCGNADLAGNPCQFDSQCGPGLSCRMANASQQSQLLPSPPRCSYLPCAPDGTCAPGTVCVPTDAALGPSADLGVCGPSICVESCQTAGCPPDWPCGSNGICELLACDQPLAPDCVTGYRCDPEVARSTTALAPLVGSALAETAAPGLEAERGCVRKKCDEDGGFVCQAAWLCQPNPTRVGESGCVSVQCSQTGHCTDDVHYLCQPQNDLPRPAGTDEHGCVVRNCSEGYLCGSESPTPYRWDCAPADPHADAAGCIVESCQIQPELCGDGEACDPTSPRANLLGCRTLDCSDSAGPRCAAGWSCDHHSAAADADGCRAGTAPVTEATGVCVHSP
jgi:hypothetical protein